jgi:hypothetical protein
MVGAAACTRAGTPHAVIVCSLPAARAARSRRCRTTMLARSRRVVASSEAKGPGSAAAAPICRLVGPTLAPLSTSPSSASTTMASLAAPPDRRAMGRRWRPSSRIRDQGSRQKKIAHFAVGYFFAAYSGGEDGNRTRLNGFAGRCITSLLPRQKLCCFPVRGKKRKPGFPLEFWSGRRVSNSRPQPWQGCALPTELLPHGALHFTTFCKPQKTGAGEESRTLDLNLGKVALYQLSYSRILQDNDYRRNCATFQG